MEGSVGVSLNSVENADGESSNGRQSELKFEGSTDQNPLFSNNGSDDADFGIEILETEPFDDENEMKEEIENTMIITQNSFDADNSIDGYFFFNKILKTSKKRFKHFTQN